MKTKIFVSKKGKGWEEVKIPKFYHRYSYDALLSVIHKFVDRKLYRGVLITENPEPFEKRVNGAPERLSA